jgi:hypothetical protein
MNLVEPVREDGNPIDTPENGIDALEFCVEKSPDFAP